MFRFERDNEDRLENHLKAEFSSQLASLWFNFRLKIIGLTMLFFISFISVFIHQWNLTNAGLYSTHVHFMGCLNGTMYLNQQFNNQIMC